jgi:hypothetical protein
VSKLIEYTTAVEMASVYSVSTKKVFELIGELKQEIDKLKQVFDDDYGFSLDLYFNGSRCDIDRCSEELSLQFKRAAWSKIVEKLGIMKYMSHKRAEKLRSQLSGDHRKYFYDGAQESEPLPEIDETTIAEVLMGMAHSAGEFLEEAIREEYDFWKPGRSEYKSNDPFTLSNKVISTYMVECPYYGGWRAVYSRAQHLTSIDNIFHALDGKGFSKEYKSTLISAIETSKDGRGETEYFRFKCYKNHNIHLEFKRLDLLQEFNMISGRNRLPEPSYGEE